MRHEGIVGPVVCVLWILGAFWFWYQAAGNPLDELALIRRAQVAPGFIVDAWEDVAENFEGRISFIHTASYTYRIPDGREFTGSVHGHGRLKEEVQDLQQPYPIEVEYLPDSPDVSRVKGNGCASITEWLWRKVGVGSFFLVLTASPGIAGLWAGVRARRRQRKRELALWESGYVDK